VLPTDQTCWHCHYELPQAAPATTKQTTAVAASEPFSLSAVGVYSALTVVIFIGFLWMTRALDQKPLVLLNLDTNVNAGWRPVTDQSVRFTFDIPPDWQVLEKLNQQQEAGFTEIVADNDVIRVALQPFPTIAGDTDLLMIVMPERSETTTAVSDFIVITRSEDIGRFSLEQITAAVTQNGNIELEETGRFRSFVGDERITFLLHSPMDDERLSCLQHIVTAVATNYLLIGCTPERRYAVYEEPFTKIMSSFQLLR
jgi:hypothetical protein